MKIISEFNALLKCLGMLCCVAVLPSSLAARTLDDLMEATISNRAIVKSYMAELQKSQKDIEYARGNFFPSVDAGYAFNLLGKNDLTKEDKENNTLYSIATLNLFSGFKDIYSLDSAKKVREMKEFGLSGIKQDIKLDVALCFLRVYEALAYLKVEEDALSLYQKEYENVKLKYSIGILKKNDLLKIKVEMDNALQDVLRARTSLSQNVNDLILKTVTKISLKELEFNCFAEIPKVLDLDHYEFLLLKKRSEINALTSLRDALKIKIKSAKSSFYPRVDALAGYKYYDDCPEESGDEIRFQLNVSVNLFDGFQKNVVVGKARLDVEKASSDLIELKRNLKNALKNFLLDFDVSMKKLEVAKNSLMEAEENLRITKLSFEKGIVTSTDILDAIYYLSRARFNLLDSRVLIFKNDFYIARMIESL